MTTSRKFRLVTADGITCVFANTELVVVPDGHGSQIRVTPTDVADLSEDLLDALMALMEGELDPEATIVWSDTAAQQYAQLEMQGIA